MPHLKRKLTESSKPADRDASPPKPKADSITTGETPPDTDRPLAPLQLLGQEVVTEGKNEKAYLSATVHTLQEVRQGNKIVSKKLTYTRDYPPGVDQNAVAREINGRKFMSELWACKAS